MTVTLYSYQSKTTYVRVEAPSLDVTFYENIMEYLCQTIPPPDLDSYKIEKYTLIDAHKPHVESLKRIFSMVQSDILKIAAWYGWGSMDDGFYSFNAFATRLQSLNRQPGFCELNLIGLNLRSIPFQIGLLTNIRKLVLHNNHIAFLPTDLTKLTKLETLDLTQNPICKLPDWFQTHMSDVRVMSENMLQDDPEEDVLTQPIASSW